MPDLTLNNEISDNEISDNKIPDNEIPDYDISGYLTFDDETFNRLIDKIIERAVKEIDAKNAKRMHNLNKKFRLLEMQILYASRDRVDIYLLIMVALCCLMFITLWF